MNVLHFLTSGGTGGIESLMRDYADYSAHNNVFVFFWKGGENSDRMAASGHKVIVLDYAKDKFFKTYLKLLKIFNENKIDSAVSHHAAPVFWLYLLLLKNKYKSLNVFMYAHGNIEDMYRSGETRVFIRNAIFAQAFKKCTAVIAISESVKNSIMARGYNPNKIKVVYNGVNCKKYDKECQRDDEVIRLIFVGRLIRQKGVQLLLEALKMLDDKYSYICDIVGDGPMRTDLEELSVDYNVSSKVVFHGTRNDVSKMLLKSHFFVHPAIWEEGFGISIVEAMAAGTIPIAFRKGAIPEIIDNEEDGFIVDECRASALSNSIENAIKMMKTERCDRMRQNAKKKAASFDLSIFVSELDKAFEKK